MKAYPRTLFGLLHDGVWRRPTLPLSPLFPSVVASPSPKARPTVSFSLLPSSLFEGQVPFSFLFLVCTLGLYDAAPLYISTVSMFF